MAEKAGTIEVNIFLEHILIPHHTIDHALIFIH